MQVNPHEDGTPDEQLDGAVWLESLGGIGLAVAIAAIAAGVYLICHGR